MIHAAACLLAAAPVSIDAGDESAERSTVRYPRG